VLAQFRAGRLRRHAAQMAVQQDFLQVVVGLARAQVIDAVAGVGVDEQRYVAASNFRRAA
jgi:hypothetical protein